MNRVKNRRNYIRILGASLLLMILMFPLVKVSAAQEEGIQIIEFKTQYKVTAAADGYFIIQDSNEKYGLLNRKGEVVVEPEYDDMQFPEDAIAYDYLLVKKGSNWGVLDYKGKILVDTVYDSVDVCRDGYKVMAAYDGNRTHIFNDKGSKIGELLGEYTIINDEVFKGSSDLKSRKDKAILSFQNSKLYFTKKGTDVQVANIYPLGKNIVADYNVGSNNDKALDEMYGKVSTYRYIKVYDQSGKSIEDITPDPNWSQSEKEVVRGGVRIDRVISDHSLIVRLMGYRNDYLSIYSIKSHQYSQMFRNISDFYDGKAFAADENGDLFIIDEEGNFLSSKKIDMGDYERLGIKTFKHEPFAIFKSKEKEPLYKLYSLLNKLSLDTVFSTVTFKRNENNEEICHGFPLVSNENGEYTILNHKGVAFFPYGTYEKKLISNNTLYALNCITIVSHDQDGGDYNVTAYYTGEGEKHNLFETPVLMYSLFGAIVLLIVLLALAFILKNKSDAKNKALVESEKKKILENKAFKRRLMEPGNDVEDEEEVDEPDDETLDRIFSNLEEDYVYGDEKDSEEEALLKGDTTVLPDLSEVTFRPESEIDEEDDEDVIQEMIEVPETVHSDELLTQEDFFGKIKCIEGAYIGAEISLCNHEWLRIGRDDSENDLVMPSRKVSRKHCAVSYDAENKQYLVIDYSRNGVYTETGKRLHQNNQSIVKAGTRLYIGNNETIIELMKDKEGKKK